MKATFALVIPLLLGLTGCDLLSTGPDRTALNPCKNCHDITPAMSLIVGPPLWEVYERMPTIEGLPFDSWTDEALDRWLAHPQSVKPKARMQYKVPDSANRRAVIEALKTLK